MQPAVFLDRDGVINENRADHVTSWSGFVPVAGALAGLRVLAALGLPIVVVTNQAIVGRDTITQAELDHLHTRMRALIARQGIEIAGVYACPHRVEDRCTCRKPQPGLLFQAAREHELDLTNSYFVGDALTDIAAGQAAGCTTVVVRTGRGRAQTCSQHAQPYTGYYVARNLRHAARFIAYDYARRRGRPCLLSAMRLAVDTVQYI